MAVYDNFSSPSVASNRGLTGKVIAATFGTVQQWNDARMTRKALSSLTVRELDDIGLIPADIDVIARR